MELLFNILRFCLICCFTTAHSHAFATETIDLLISSNPQSNFVAKLLEEKLLLNKKDLNIREISSVQQINYKADEKTTLIVSVGTKATLNLINNDPNKPFYSLMVPQVAFQAIITTSKTLPTFSALYLDQPLERYLQLINNLTPSARTIGIFSNNQLSGKFQHAQEIAQEYGMKLQTREIKTLSNPLSEINELFMQSDIVLLVPEKTINPLMTKWILFSAYKHQKPVIGFSKQLLEGGALASLHSNLDRLSDQAAKELDTYFRTQQFNKEPGYPNDYDVEINSAVADSLNIQIDTYKLE